MILCNGKPFLWFLLDKLSGQGVANFILLVGYKSDEIINFFGDGKKWGWNITYSQGPIEWDTGKRIWEAKNFFKRQFILLYSDNFTLYNLDAHFKVHSANNKTLTLLLVKKCPGNISVNKKNIVRKFDSIRTSKNNYVEIGFILVNKPSFIKFFEKYKKLEYQVNLSKIIQEITKAREVAAFFQEDSYYSISDPLRWKETCEYLSFKKIIFIDRDGVINKKVKQGEYVEHYEDFHFIKETETALKKLSNKGFSFIVITNQAGVARKKITKANLNLIHKKMKDYFKSIHVNILDVYVCTHHWSDNCSCRKPKAGLIFEASRKHLIRLDSSFFIGDSECDAGAAKNSGLKSIIIGPKFPDFMKNYPNAKYFRSIKSASNFILKNFDDNIQNSF
jgi:histidinol-phosphate phosphatase family protein